MLNIQTQFLFNLKAAVGDNYQTVGSTPNGLRLIVTIAEGSFEGPKLKGTVLSGGDWAIIRSDRVMEVDVRLTLKTEDDSLIYMTYRGLVRDAPEVFKRRARGEILNPSDVYFRTAILFETSSEKYKWLNETLALGIGQLTPNFVIYDIHEFL